MWSNFIFAGCPPFSVPDKLVYGEVEEGSSLCPI